MNSLQNPTTRKFAPTSTTAEDLLREQTVGLVHLSDFRKRRAEAVEHKEREREALGIKSDGGSGLRRFAKAEGGTGSDGQTPPAEMSSSDSPTTRRQKKKRKIVSKGKLSFGLDHDEEVSPKSERPSTDQSSGPASMAEPKTTSLTTSSISRQTPPKRLGPNTSLTRPPPVALTRSSIAALASQREILRREFLELQAIVRATSIALPFVFHDGTDTQGGSIILTKGSQVWLFLDKARKVGAGLGVGGKEDGRGLREWARVGVDDLMLVRSSVIIPHHMEFYSFIVQKVKGPEGNLLFAYSDSAPDSSSNEDQKPEGWDHEPRITKVVDRRWYERNKHIYPASTWEEYDPEKDYTKLVRRDQGGNAFFFS